MTDTKRPLDELKETLNAELTYQEWKELVSGMAMTLLIASFVGFIILGIASMMNPTSWYALLLVQIMKIIEVGLLTCISILGFIAVIGFLFLCYKALAGIPKYGKRLWIELGSDPELKQDEIEANNHVSTETMTGN